MKKIINYAHRGASAVCPENTMAAFRKALDLGATGIETDVQMTKDGEIVIIHDENLKRTTGLNKLVKDTNLREIESLDAGQWKAPEFAGERVPTLKAVLTFARETGVVLNLELKNTLVPYLGMEQKVVELVREFKMTEQVILSSFNHYSLALCKQLSPEIRTGILYSESLYRPWDYARTLHANALHPYYPAVYPDWVAQAAEHGIVYHPFTVNRPADIERLISFGVAGIMTDYPDRLAQLLAQSER